MAFTFKSIEPPVLPITKAAGRGRTWVRSLSEKMRRKLQGPFIKEVELLRESLRDGDLANAVLSRDDARVIQASRVDRVGSIVGTLNEPIEEALEAGGRLAMARIKTPAVALDLQRPQVRRWLERHSAELVRGVNKTSRKAVRAIVADGFKRGRHPMAMAKDIRAVVGLTEPQARAVIRLRATMIEAGASEGAVEKRAARYARRLLKRRAENIARTESMTAINQGRLSMWRQLAEDGALDEDSERTWLTADDERVCPICGPMHNVSIPLNGNYETSVGVIEAPPAHPSCRCTEEIR